MSAAIGYYGGIVTDGLVLYMDTSKRDSYSFSETKLINVARGDLLSGSFVNGTTLTNDLKGIQFDGINDYVFLPINFFNHANGTPFTVSLWFKSATNGSVLFGQQSTSTPDVAAGWVPAIYINTSGKIVTSCFWGGNTGNTSTSLITVTDDIWHNIVVTFESTSHKSYLDGILFDTIVKTQTSYTSPYYYFLGTGKYTSWTGAGSTPYLNGALNNFMFYNKALSTSQILQNYNALKGRFGL